MKQTYMIYMTEKLISVKMFSVVRKTMHEQHENFNKEIANIYYKCTKQKP